MGHDSFYHTPIQSQTHRFLGGLNQGYPNRIGESAAIRPLSLAKFIKNSDTEEEAGIKANFRDKTLGGEA